MNPFVNLRKRSIDLPAGCKNLADLLQRPKHRGYESIRSFLLLILMGAQQEGASKVIIEVAPENGGDTLIQCKIGNTGSATCFPSDIRALVIAELFSMAEISEGSSPKVGTLSLSVGTTHLKWRVRMTSPDSECLLTRLKD